MISLTNIFVGKNSNYYILARRARNMTDNNPKKTDKKDDCCGEAELEAEAERAADAAHELRCEMYHGPY